MTRLLGWIRDERGTALTEFVIFLPIWIVMFMFIINMGQIGMVSTGVQLKAQRDLWSKAINPSAEYGPDIHFSLLSGTGDAIAKYGDLAGNASNDQQVNDGVEAGALALAHLTYGHFGEAAEKAAIPLYPFMPDSIQGKYEPTEILDQDDTNRYPHKVLNDALAETSFDGGVLEVIASIVGGTGLPHALGAGIRYGSVFAEASETSSLMRYGSYTAEAHMDALVPPHAMVGDHLAKWVPFTVAYLLFKTDDRYGDNGGVTWKYMRYGEENWGGGDGAYDVPTEESERNKAEEQAEDEDRQQEAQDEECASMRAGSSYDPNADPPQTPPSWWEDCGF